MLQLLTMCATTRKPVQCNSWAHMLWSPHSITREKPSCSNKETKGHNKKSLMAQLGPTAQKYIKKINLLINFKKRVKFSFSVIHWLSWKYIPLLVKDKPSRGLSFYCRIPRLRNQMWDLNPLLFGENPEFVIILPFVSFSPGALGLDYTMFLPLLTVSLWFLLYIFIIFFSASLQVDLIDSYSVNSCNINVPVRGGKLKVFLLFQFFYFLFPK